MSSPRRVLSISTLFPNAHAPQFGTFVARQLEALAARGDWEVTVINPIGVPPVAIGRYRALARAAVDGVENGVIVYRPRFTLIPLLGGRYNPDFITRAILPLARKLHAARPFDLVDAQFFYPDGPAAATIARALGLPLSIKARGADIHYWCTVPAAKVRALAAADQAAGLLAVSEALADAMAALGMQREKIAIHYTGLDRERFHPRDKAAARQEVSTRFGLAFPPDTPLLSSVGAFIARKGQEFVIAALRQLPGAQLALVGTGPDEHELRYCALRDGVADRVHFLGSLDHEALPLVLAASDAMVLPSSSEGLANVWVEALACGTPIVICDVGGAREVVRNASAGRLVEREEHAIAAAIKALLAAPPSPQDVAANVALFSWEASAARLAGYYRRLLG